MKTPLEICEYLTHYVNPDYCWVRFHECSYREEEDVLTAVFLYDERLKKKLETIKPRLEEEFRNAVIEHIGSCGLKYRFLYRQSYLDKTSLEMKVRQFLTGEFSILTLSLDEEDIKTTGDDHHEHFTVNIFLPKQAAEYIKKSKAFEKFLLNLRQTYFSTINIFFNEKSSHGADEDDDGFFALEQYILNKLPEDKNVKVDKTMKVKNIEYYLGKPIKERPIKVEFLKTNGDEQVIAGTISFLARREYKRTDKDGAEEMRSYYTWTLDDGKDRAQCVFFPTSNTRAKFEKLVNGTVVCAIGTNSERNGRVSFRALGISFCELI